MSQFSIDTVEPLDYDFTGIDNDSGKGKCSGKGTIPEPTKGKLKAYGLGIRKLFGLDEDEDAAGAIESNTPKADDGKTDEEREDALLSLTSALCGGSPSKAELKKLPPRYRAAFLKWVYKEISNPEV